MPAQHPRSRPIAAYLASLVGALRFLCQKLRNNTGNFVIMQRLKIVICLGGKRVNGFPTPTLTRRVRADP
jgi:hypothetical protein